MAGSLSNFAEDGFNDHVLKVAPLTQPVAIYVALSTADPTDDGSGIAEPASNYARVNYENWSAAASRRSGNAALIQFAVAAASWGTITHWAIFDAVTGGNMLFHGDLTNPSVVINAGNRFEFAIDTLQPTMGAGGWSDFLANSGIDHLLINTAYTVPTNIYLAACDSATADADTGSTISEPAGGSYARFLENDFNASSGGATANTNDSSFIEATASWGTITHIALVDALTVGNLLMHGAVDSSQAIGSGDTLQFDAGALDITLD